MKIARSLNLGVLYILFHLTLHFLLTMISFISFNSSYPYIFGRIFIYCSCSKHLLYNNFLRLSIQVQFVQYQTRSGLIQFHHYTERDLVSYQCQYRLQQSNRSIPILKADLRSYVLTKNYITFNTVSKAQSQSTEVYFVVQMKNRSLTAQLNVCAVISITKLTIPIWL